MAITRYDFSKPSKFAKNHIAGFRNIYEYFCKTSSIILETLLRNEEKNNCIGRRRSCPRCDTYALHLLSYTQVHRRKAA